MLLGVNLHEIGVVHRDVHTLVGVSGSTDSVCIFLCKAAASPLLAFQLAAYVASLFFRTIDVLTGMSEVCASCCVAKRTPLFSKFQQVYM